MVNTLAMLVADSSLQTSFIDLCSMHCRKRQKSNRLSAGSNRRKSLEALAESTNLQAVHSSLHSLHLR